MQIESYTACLNVPEPGASADFICRHFGFHVLMAIDEMVSVGHQDSPFTIAFLREGLSSFEPKSHSGTADGVVLAFTVADVDAEYARLVAAGAPVATSIRTEPWGERYFQVQDPNGVILEALGWLERPEAGVGGAAQ